MVAHFCNIIVAVGSVLSNFRAADMDSLISFCGDEMIVFVLVGLVPATVVVDVVGSQKVEIR